MKILKMICAVLLAFTLAEFEPGLSILLMTGRLEGGAMRGVADFGSFGGSEWIARRIAVPAPASPWSASQEFTTARGDLPR